MPKLDPRHFTPRTRVLRTPAHVAFPPSHRTRLMPSRTGSKNPSCFRDHFTREVIAGVDVCRNGGYRHGDGKRRAFSLNAGNEDPATVLGYNTLGHAQTKPCPFPSGFGGEEGIKDGIQDVFRYPAAKIYHFYR